EDFDSVYGKGFFAGKKISISGWSFSNRPDVPGLYSVFMDCDIEMDGSSLGFSDGKVYFSFLPVKGLSELGAFFSENKLLWLPFDAPLGGKDRDYGSAVNGSIQLNDKILVSDLGGRAISEPEITAMSNKGGKALVEASSGSNFADTASGLVLAVAEGEPGKFVLKFNKPIPSVVSLFLPEEKAYEVYYTLTDSAGKPLPDSFFGEREFLLDWRVPGKFFVKDSFPVLRPDIKCSGWNDDLKSAKFKADVTGLGSNFYYSIAFLPEDTALSVLCVSGPDVRFDMNSYNGKNFVFVKSVKPAPNQLGFSTLRPWPFEGGFSLKDALAEVGKGNMCFSVDESGTDALIWNAKALREKVWPEKSGSTGEGQKGNGDSSASGLDSAVQQFAALSGAFGGVQAIAGFSALSTVESNLPGISAAASAKSQVVGACSQYVGCFGNSTFPCCDVSSGLCVECTAGCGCKEGEQCSLFTNACIPKAQEPSFANNLVDNMVVSATKTSEGTFELFTISGKKAEVSEKDLQVALADLESHAGFSLSASIEGVDDIQNPSMTVCDTIVIVPKGTVVKQGSKGSYWRSSGMAALGFTLLADDVSVVGISDDVVAVTLIAAAGIQLIVTNYRQALAGRTIYVEYPDVCLLSPHVYAPPVTDVGTDGVGTDGVGADGAGTDGVGTDVGIDEGAAIEEGTVVKIGNTYFVLTDNGVSPVKEPPPEKKPGDDKQSFFKKFMERAKLPVVGVTII
ncbi:MAG: hypothetical protein NT067_02515, partial [Candidatus Diapherotrites archaeon]|nr:hypothetical protein [Candidatus Diapherotrites archaeon]